jgi:hypothetical protein
VSGSEPPHALPDAPPDISESGVDRAQNREMLRLSPGERLRRVEDFVGSVLGIREITEPRTVR